MLGLTTGKPYMTQKLIEILEISDGAELESHTLKDLDKVIEFAAPRWKNQLAANEWQEYKFFFDHPFHERESQSFCQYKNK